MSTYEQFAQLDLRVGTIVAVKSFPEARDPAFKLEIDFGPLGLKRSSAQITKRYTIESLIDRQIIAVVNLPPRRIAGYISEVLVLGVVQEKGDVVLLKPEVPMPNGAPIA